MLQKSEAAMLARIFDQHLVDIQHIGSTAVPGLAAKPIIDILIVLDRTDDIARSIHLWRTLFSFGR